MRRPYTQQVGAGPQLGTPPSHHALTHVNTHNTSPSPLAMRLGSRLGTNTYATHIMKTQPSPGSLLYEGKTPTKARRRGVGSVDRLHQGKAVSHRGKHQHEVMYTMTSKVAGMRVVNRTITPGAIHTQIVHRFSPSRSSYAQ